MEVQHDTSLEVLVLRLQHIHLFLSDNSVEPLFAPRLPTSWKLTLLMSFMQSLHLGYICWIKWK